MSNSYQGTYNSHALTISVVFPAGEVVIKIHCASSNLESRPIEATGILDLVHVRGDIATGSAERGVALKQGVRINFLRSNSLGSLVSETCLVAQVDTALVRAAHNGAVF